MDFDERTTPGAAEYLETRLARARAWLALPEAERARDVASWRALGRLAGIRAMLAATGCDLATCAAAIPSEKK